MRRFAILFVLVGGCELVGQPSLRLDDSSVPQEYRAVLTVDPEKDRFQAELEVDVVFRRGIDVLWLNARELTIDSAEVTQNGQVRKLESVAGGDDFVGFRSDSPFAPGGSTLRVRYSGPVGSNRPSGLFRQKDGRSWYAFTQMAAVDARRVFPCYDEPSFRARWQITLRVPKGMRGYSNTPEKGRSSEADGDRLTFKTTPPIPSYLLAFAVGPFEAVRGRPAGAKQVPVRILVPKGRKAAARGAAEVTAGIIERLEAYTGSPYPFEKLDSIALPRATFSAMENPGLIVYQQSILLGNVKRYERVAAHELAHQWFGNLVTMRWWDDVWLSEGLATWLSAKIMHEEAREVFDIGDTMLADESDGSQPIRGLVETLTNIMDIYNQFTYTKAGAITAMFEQWVGEQAFQAAIRKYLESFAWKAADTNDFLGVVSGAAGRDVAPFWMPFLTTTGVPIISAKLECSTPDEQRLILSSEDEERQTPVCYRTPEGGGCVSVVQREAAQRLGAQCPSWLIPNAGARGYYRLDTDSELLRRLRREGAAQASEGETAALARDMIVLTGRGKLPLREALLLAPELTRKHEKATTQRIKTWLKQVRQALPDSERRYLAAYLRQAVENGADKTLLEVEREAADPSARFAPEEAGANAAAAPDEIAKRLIASGSYEYIMSHYEELERQLPPDALADLPKAAAGLCSEDKAQDVERFFGSRNFRRELPGVLRTIRGCAQLRRAQSPLEGVVPRGQEAN